MFKYGREGEGAEKRWRREKGRGRGKRNRQWERLSFSPPLLLWEPETPVFQDEHSKLDCELVGESTHFRISPMVSEESEILEQTVCRIHQKCSLNTLGKQSQKTCNPKLSNYIIKANSARGSTSFPVPQLPSQSVCWLISAHSHTHVKAQQSIMTA